MTPIIFKTKDIPCSDEKQAQLVFLRFSMSQAIVGAANILPSAVQHDLVWIDFALGWEQQDVNDVSSDKERSFTDVETLMSSLMPLFGFFIIRYYLYKSLFLKPWLLAACNGHIKRSQKYWIELKRNSL